MIARMANASSGKNKTDFFNQIAILNFDRDLIWLSAGEIDEYKEEFAQMTSSFGLFSILFMIARMAKASSGSSRLYSCFRSSCTSGWIASHGAYAE